MRGSTGHVRWGIGITSALREAARRRRARHRRRSQGPTARFASLEPLEPRQVLSAIPIISEVLASNGRTIEDVDGDDSDYIELYNAGDDDMSLNRYYLTDDPEDLRKWRFPDVALGGGEYLVVFASSKDRNDPNEQLHTNFRLSTTGEYVALVKPDGETVAFEYAPGYPQQVTDVSYGVPTGLKSASLLSPGAAARVLIPTNGDLDQTRPNVVDGTWLQPNYDDSAAGWFDATTGVGYVPPNTPIVLADSVADFSGVQGQSNWYYGTWTKNFDADKVYSTSEFGPLNQERFFVAAENKWDVGLNGQPPSTELTPTGGHPAGAPQGGFGFTHWAIRRWQSETSGEITIQGTLANLDPTGDGIIGRILVNGTEIYQQLINGASTEYNVTANVATGDLIDFVIDAGLVDNETGDNSTFTATIRGLALRDVPQVKIADSSDDWTRAVQGAKGWTYGHYDVLRDPNGQYDPENFRAFPLSFWNTNRWEWPDGSVDTSIRSTSQQAHASATAVHWAVRRWESPIDGTLVIEYDFSKALSGGDGTTGRLFHNGHQIDMVQIAGDDRVGVTRKVTVSGVRRGDVLDFAVDARGPNAATLEGTNDRATVDLRIHRLADLSESIASDIRQSMQGVGSGAYLRIPFQVDDLSTLDVLTLNMKYDDGFVAYLNGIPIASGNAPDVAAYNSVASSSRSTVDATVYESFDLTDRRGLFVPGTNVLQIHALNASINDDDLLILPELIVGTLTAETDQSKYFSVPTPGGPNGLGTDTVGPLVVESTHSPHLPTEAQPLVVHATVSSTFDQVAQVELTYRVMYGEHIVVAMHDDGQGQDSVAGDGIYTTVIPAAIAKPGEMIRWYITASDSKGLTGRLPANRVAAKDEEYLGTIVADTSISSQLPVFHMFVESFARASTTTGESGSMFYDGEFYDNVLYSLHGQSSSGFPTPKKSLNVDFPNDHRLRLRDDLQRMEDINLLTNFADKAKTRNTLAYEQLAMTGGASHLAFPVRVQRNGQFFAVYDFVEDADERWLERLGFDSGDALYKIYNVFDTAAGSEKKTNTDTGNQDLAAVIAGIRQTGAAGINYILDNVNLARMADFLAAYSITSNQDCCHKNYYAYRDTTGTGEWSFFSWDNDLTQGRNWGGLGLNYFDDTIYPNNVLFTGSNNALLSRLVNNVPGFRDMWLRRIRTLMDEYVKPPGTPRDELPLETRVDELVALMKPDADLDNQVNPYTWGQTGFQTFEQANQILIDEYAGPRRDFLYGQTVADPTGMPVLLSGEPGTVTGKYFIPTDDSLGRNWTSKDFDDGGWSSGPTAIGFEIGTSNYTNLLRTDLGDQLKGKTSLYVRVPFNVADPAALTGLSLRMKYEDGYVAYVNGVEVVRKGLRQDTPTFNSTSTSRSNRLAVEFENVNISQFRNLLQPGENILAIHAINSSTTSDDMFVLPELLDGILTGGQGEIPAGQRTNPKLDFGAYDASPRSGNQQEEYLTLVNNNTTSVDISGWRLTGDIEWTFDPGTVLPAGFTLYATPDARAFRARTEGPSGGKQLFVQGNYEGSLPNPGGSVQLVARDGTVVNEFSYTGEESTLAHHLRISEVMYNPIGPSAAELAADNSLVSDDFEYIELVNTSPTLTLDLAGAQLVDGVEFSFTGSPVTQLEPGGRTIIVRNLSAFQIRYGADLLPQVAGEFANNTALRDTGDRITLMTVDSTMIVDFEYSDAAHQGWPERADGRGSSLQIVDPLHDAQEPTNWRASREVNGSPARPGAVATTGIVINEVLSRSIAPQTDLIELYNASTEPIQLGGYYLSDSAESVDALRKFALPNQTIAPNAYWVLSEANFNPGAGTLPTDFALDGIDGDQLYLTIGDAAQLTHFSDAVSFDAAAPGESFGRAPNGSGQLYPNMGQTFSAANSVPRVGPLVITEIMYKPAEPTAAALDLYASLTVDDLEYIEVFNPGPSLVLDNWRIRLGVDFDFDDGTTLGSGQTLLVVPFNPTNPVNASRTAAFRAHYGLSADVALVGGFAGQLSDQGDGVRLVRPGEPTGNPAVIPRLLEDEIVYDNIAPWQNAPGIAGVSLQRKSASTLGSNPASWSIDTPRPGSFGGNITGDVTGDGRIDMQDIDRLQQAALSGDNSVDLTGNGTVDKEDLVYLVEDILGTKIGDVNLDGRFDSRDLVALFIVGEFEDGTAKNSLYRDGDWDLDGDFTTADLLFALQRGAYDQEPGAVAAVAGNAAAAIAGERHSPQSQHDGSSFVIARLDEQHRPRQIVEQSTFDAVFADFDEFAEVTSSQSSPDRWDAGDDGNEDWSLTK